jgi:isopentenyl phosphate kinase
MNNISDNTHEPTADLIFLKLGGSLITDKTRAHTARLDTLSRLADEIAAALNEYPYLKLVLGNGAGSFGHVPAAKYNTRQSVETAQEWRGFSEVWQEAATLNQLVTTSLHKAGLPAIAIHPSSAVTAQDGQVLAWDISPLSTALKMNLLPVIHGDVVFDTVRGGTILSTEDLFEYLAGLLKPRRILLAGLEEGVWTDYPRRTKYLSEITKDNFDKSTAGLGGSAGTDVTGGMASKVEQSMSLVNKHAGLEVLIFSGVKPGNVRAAISGNHIGTKIYS